MGISIRLKKSSAIIRNCRWLVVAVVALTGIFIVGLWHEYSFGTTPDLASISSATSIKFPRSARLLNSHRTIGWQDDFTLAKISMSTSDLQTFVKALSIPNDISSKDRFGISNDMLVGKNPEWWDPDSVQKFTAVRFRLRGNFFVLVFISLDTTEQTVIYLVL